MNRRSFIKRGALWVPPLFAIGRARGQALTLADPAMVGRSRPVASSACATTDTSIAHDELLEGFQTATTGYENTWVESGTTANIDSYADSSALTTGKPTGACDRAWKLTIPSDGTETFATWTRGSDIDLDTQSVVVTFYYYIESHPASGKTFYVFDVMDNVGNSVARLSLWNNSGTQLARIVTSGTSSTYLTPVSGQWAKVTITLATGTGATDCTFDYNGTSLAFGRAASRDFRKVVIGPNNGLEAGDADGTNIWFDLICVHTP